MTKNAKIISYFEDIPNLLLSEERLKEGFAFPTIDQSLNKGKGAFVPSSGRGTSKGRRQQLEHPRGVIGALTKSLEIVTRKLVFGGQTIEEWRNALVYSGDRMVKSDRQAPSSFRRLKKYNPYTDSSWRRGQAINLSESVLDSWFLNNLLSNIIESELSHEILVHGAPGTGKSTIFKCQIAKHAKIIAKREIVFSRFEFRKALKFYSESGGVDKKNLSYYMSTIHFRDLFLAYFCELTNGNQYVVRGRNVEKRIDELFFASDICFDQMNIRFNDLDKEALKVSMLEVLCPPELKKMCDNVISFNDPKVVTLANVSKLANSLTDKQRGALIPALAGDKTLCTIFDGLDLLTFNDLTTNSVVSNMAKYILEFRSELSCPQRAKEIGISVSSRSIVVMRTNSFALLRDRDIGDKFTRFEQIYEVENCAPYAAAFNAFRRAFSAFDERFKRGEYKEGQTGDCDDQSEIHANKLLGLTRASILSLLYQVPRVRGRKLRDYVDVFSGNFRELSKFWNLFLAQVSSRHLSSSTDTSFFLRSDLTLTELVEELLSREAEQIRKSKSYKLIEFLILESSGDFENSILVKNKIDNLSDEFDGYYITQNEMKRSHFDNLFGCFPELTYEMSPAGQCERFLDKFFILNFCRNENLNVEGISERFHKFSRKISNKEIKFCLHVLLQVDYISAYVDPDTSQPRYRTTRRALFALDVMSGSLSFVENCFHKTVFPRTLIEHISFKTRSLSSHDEWVSQSLRSAFIFLSYLKYVVNMRGNPIGKTYYAEASKQITLSVHRILRSLDNTDKLNLGEDVPTRSLKLIEETLSDWKSKHIISS